MAHLLAQQPFQFNAHRASPLKDMSGDCSSDYPKHPIIPLEAKNAIGEGETKDPNHLGFLHLSWTVVLRVIEVHCQ